jgi:hypothetical protein
VLGSLRRSSWSPSRGLYRVSTTLRKGVGVRLRNHPTTWSLGNGWALASARLSTFNNYRRGISGRKNREDLSSPRVCALNTK